VKATQWTAAIAGGVLSLIHPEQYLLGRLSLLRLAERQEDVRSPEAMLDALRIWSSPCNAMSVMVNRVTPTHRDTQGRDPWMDILLTHGPYTDCRMEFRSLGVRVDYGSGTMVGVCGKVVPHAASECIGERACIAYYMRDRVHERLGVPAGGWMNIVN
jgi:Oxygenase domain of the 2OGFeDO superfamily